MNDLLIDPERESVELTTMARIALDHARRLGASDAEVAASVESGFAVTVRRSELETVEFSRDRSFGVTVYRGHSRGSASTTDTRPDAIRATVAAACAIAAHTEADPANGLAEAGLFPVLPIDLDLDHPSPLTVEAAIDMARECEAAAFAVDPRIGNSEGASRGTWRSTRMLANSRGFVGVQSGTRHSLSCVVVAEEGGGMQRDYWYSADRREERLESPHAVGRRAGERAVARLGATPLSTRRVPVLFAAEIAGSLIGHLLGAISGSAQYRRASFLLDAVGQPLFPDWFALEEQPHLPAGAASAAWDSDGVATRRQHFVEHGVLTRYVLGTYSARRLGLATTGNAGGVHNLQVSHGTAGLDELVAGIDDGLLVTELLGQGVNAVTGDYSRGAAGFHVHAGRIVGPVHEVTIAGQLREMFRQVVAVGADVDRRGSLHVGSILVDGMTVAGA